MAQPWHITWLQLERGLWRETKGAGVKLALLDSGVAEVPGMDEGRVRRRSHGGELGRPRDSSSDGHGTSVAAIVGSDAPQVPGIAPEAELECFAVYGVDARPAAFRVAKALSKAVELGVDAICCTFTLPRLDEDLEAALAEAAEAKIPVIVAAGNRANLAAEFPEKVEGLITVAALTNRGVLVPNTRYGSWTSVAAPGLNIRTWSPGGRINNRFTGTSAAAPVFTGVFALLLAAAEARGGAEARGRVREQLAELLRETSERRGPVPILQTESLSQASAALADRR